MKNEKIVVRDAVSIIVIKVCISVSVAILLVKIWEVIDTYCTIIIVIVYVARTLAL